MGKYITKDGVVVDNDDNDSIIIYRPVPIFMSLEDVKSIDNLVLPKLNTENLILKKNEYCCFIDNCRTFEIRTETTGYTGTNTGYSYKIGKKMSIHSGSRNSKAIKQTHTNYYEGTIFITNKRIVYISSGNDSFDKPIDKISSVNEIQDGIIIQIGSKRHIIVFDTHTLFMQVLGIVKHNEFGTQLPEALTNKNVHFTCDPYIMELQKKQENDSLPKDANATKTDNKKYLICGLVIFIILLIISQVSLNQSNYQKNVMQYSDTQIISMPSHPKILSDFSDTIDFYKNIDGKKVKISKGHAYYYDDEKHLIYMEIDNNNKQIIDDIRLYLNISKEYNAIDLNTAIQIALDYLPLDIINNNYSFKDSFKETIGNSSKTISKYYYHWEINDIGKEYRKNNDFLPNELGFKIYHDEANNTFRIFIGSNAVTLDEHVRYLDNKCDNWSIDINNFK